jgi:hypothetical protein
MNAAFLIAGQASLYPSQSTKVMEVFKKYVKKN